MKALLTELGIAFPKTHDLGALLRLVPSGTTALADLRGPLEFLGMRAVESRYPGIDVGESGALEALQTARSVRHEVSKYFEEV